MTKVGSILEQRELSLCRAPSWSKRGMYIKRVPTGCSPAQARARLAMIQAGKAAAGATAGLSGAARVHAMNQHVSQQLAGQSHGGNPPGYRSRPAGYRTEAQLRRIAGQGAGGGLRLPPPPSFGGGAYF